MEQTNCPTKDSGFNPKYQILSDMYCTDYYNESSSVKNSVFDLLKNQTIIVQDANVQEAVFCE